MSSWKREAGLLLANGGRAVGSATEISCGDHQMTAQPITDSSGRLATGYRSLKSLRRSSGFAGASRCYVGALSFVNTCIQAHSSARFSPCAEPVLPDPFREVPRWYSYCIWQVM